MKNINFRDYIKDLTQLELFTINYKYNKAEVRTHTFYFENNKTLSGNLFLLDGGSPEPFLEINNPQSRYYETAFKIENIPVRYGQNSYDRAKDYFAIMIDQKGNIQPLAYTFTAKGFGYTGYIKKTERELFLNKKDAIIASEKYAREKTAKAIEELINIYPLAKQMIHIISEDNNDKSS